MRYEHPNEAGVIAAFSTKGEYGIICNNQRDALTMIRDLSTVINSYTNQGKDPGDANVFLPYYGGVAISVGYIGGLLEYISDSLDTIFCDDVDATRAYVEQIIKPRFDDASPMFERRYMGKFVGVDKTEDPLGEFLNNYKISDSEAHV